MNGTKEGMKEDGQERGGEERRPENTTVAPIDLPSELSTIKVNPSSVTVQPSQHRYKRRTTWSRVGWHAVDGVW